MTDETGDTDQSPLRSCRFASMGVVAMLVVLTVTSLMTLGAGAQLPSTSTGAEGETTGARAGGTAGLIVLAVVFAVVVGGAVVLYFRNRSTKS